MQTKKQMILWVLNILNTDSDKQHPITQTGLTKIISGVYPCDRKTVCRNIKYVKEMGYPIVKTSKGFYMDKKLFSVEETEFVINAVRSSNGKTEEEKEEIINRLMNHLTSIKRQKKSEQKTTEENEKWE